MNIIIIIIFNNCSKINFELNLLIDLVSLITEKSIKHRGNTKGIVNEIEIEALTHIPWSSHRHNTLAIGCKNI